MQVDNLHRLLGCFLPGAHIILDHLLHIVYRVEIDIVEIAHLCLNVSGDSDIDHKHRLMAAFFQCAFDCAFSQDRQRAGGRGYNDIRFR